MQRNEIWRSYGTDYKDMTKRLLAQSGLEDLLPASADACIAVKPNLVTPAPASFGGTTHPEIVAGKRILLIDDVVTTGSTLSECARTLLMAGAESVVCAALAKAGRV